MTSASLFDGIPETVLVHDEHGIILHINDVGAQRLEWPSTELVGRNLDDIVTRPSAKAIARQVHRTLTEGTSSLEMTFITRTGQPLEAEVSERSIEFEGRPAILSVARDITARKQAMTVLQAAKEYAENLIHSSLDMIISVDMERKIIEFNKAAQCTFGYTKAEVLGKHVDMLYANPSESLRTHKQSLRGEGFTGEITNKGKHGELFRSYLAASVLRNGNGEVVGVMGISRDITEHRRAKEALQRLAMAVEHAAESIVITDPTGTILYTNPTFARTTGYACQAALGQNMRLLKSGQHDQAFYRAMWATLQGGEIWSSRITNKKRDGTLYDADITISPVRDADGRIPNYVAVLRDVTREVALEAQLRQAQKMEAIGQLAGGVAHDFNNLLAGILGYANLLKLGAQPGDKVFQAADVIEQAVKRGAEITQQLLGFARRGKYQHTSVDLDRAIQGVIALLSRTIDKRITMTQRLRAQGVVVQGDPSQLQQVILNLALNARDAMPDGGELIFETSLVVLDEAYCRQHAGVTPGPCVLLSVTDSGVGIPKDQQDRIFEPFFTTKQPGKGTGMGLAMVYGIVKNHGGSIRVYSEVGHGTTFKVYLPYAAAGSPPAGDDGNATPVRGRGRILVVDDETMVRDVAVEMLQHLGYEVVTAADGQEAVEYYRQWGHAIDLLVLDLVMPRLGGQECFRAIKSMNPHVKVLVSSGYDRNDAVQELLSEGAQGFVQKPYQMRQLSEAVAKGLGREACADASPPGNGSTLTCLRPALAPGAAVVP